MPRLVLPNIVLVQFDDVDFRQITNESMPFLTSALDGSWVDFPNGVCTTPLCYPHRASMLTCQRADHHPHHDNQGVPFAGDWADTIGPWLRAAGYETAFILKLLNDFPWGSPFVPPGWDYFMGEGTSDKYINWEIVQTNGSVLVGGSSDADYLTDRGAQWAAQFIAQASPPWFLRWDPPCAHDPLKVATRHQSAPVTFVDPPNWNPADVSTKPAWMQNRAPLTTAEQDAVRTDQIKARRTLMAGDEGIETIWDAVDAVGQLDNTIFVMIGDGGALRGLHRARQTDGGAKKKNAYHECVSACLRVRYPTAAGRVDTTPVSTLDMLAMLLAHAEAVPTHEIDGVDMTDVVLGTATGWRPTGVESCYRRTLSGSPIPAWWMLLDPAGRWKYVTYETGETELYDRQVDPYELVSVHADPGNAERIAAMDADLQALIADPKWWAGDDPTPPAAVGRYRPQNLARRLR
ncbi:MAG TPA: sulfatase-like hydrolase/transferase [Nocardioides sp.]